MVISPIIKQRGQTALEEMVIMGQLLIKRLTLRLAHFAIWQDENITRRRSHALAPVVQLQRLRHIAPLIVQRYANANAARSGHQIQRQNFAARPRQRIGLTGRQVVFYAAFR